MEPLDSKPKNLKEYLRRTGKQAYLKKEGKDVRDL